MDMMSNNFTDKLLDVGLLFLIYFMELSALFIAINFAVSYLQTRFEIKLKKHLNSHRPTSHLKAIALGSLTPFCSCSSIPLFAALIRSGVSLSVSLSYLITSPLINPIIFVMLLSAFGVQISLFYTFFVICFVLVFTLLLSQIRQDSLLKADFFADTKPTACCQKPNTAKFSAFSTTFSPNHKMPNPTHFSLAQMPHASQKLDVKPTTCCNQTTQNTSQNPLKSHWQKSLRDYYKMLPYIAIGMGIGVFLHGFVPDGLLENLSDWGVVGVIGAAFAGILLYLRVEMLIPIALALSAQGVPLGILMSFLIAGAGCSLPELILLKRMFVWRFLVLFVGLVLGVAIGFGLILHYVLGG